MKCVKCDKGDPTNDDGWQTGWLAVNGKPSNHRWFCSLDCLSRWVEVQRLIAVVEERP